MYPFAVALDVPHSLDAIEVRVAFAAGVADDDARDATEVMAAYASLGAVGALSGLHLRPSQARLALSDVRIDGPQGRWSFTGADVDPCALFVLLNMLHWVHLEIAPLARATIAWPENRRPSDTQRPCFPGACESLSFDCDFDDEGRAIDVTVDFAAPQPEPVVRQVVDAMSRWLLATHRGAYANAAFDPSNSLVAMGPDVMSLSADRVIWYLDQIRCDDAALDGLVNVLEFVSHRIAPIRRVHFS